MPNCLLKTLLPLALFLAASPAAAQAPSCPLPGQKPMLIARLYFGEDIPGRKPLTAEEWRTFLSDIVTPRFPSGFTVYDGSGQWQNPKTQTIGRENTKVVEIAAENSASVRANLADIAAAYRKQFQQESVGVVTSLECAGF